MEKVVIFGATKMAVMTHFYFAHDSHYEVVAFTVDRDYLKEETFCDCRSFLSRVLNPFIHRVGTKCLWLSSLEG